jgi:hypothetical protein
VSRSPAVALLALAMLGAAGLAWWLYDSARGQQEEGQAPEVVERSDRRAAEPPGPRLNAAQPTVIRPPGTWAAPGMLGQDLSGKVVGADDAALSGVTVEVRAVNAATGTPAATGPSVRTGRDGAFRFLGLEPGPVRVLARREGMVDVELATQVPASDVVLRLAAGHVLEGSVLGGGRLGIPDVVVSLRMGQSGRWRTARTISDADGLFRFAGLPYAGLVELAADAGIRGRAPAERMVWTLGKPLDVLLGPPVPMTTVNVRVSERLPDDAPRPRPKQGLWWTIEPLTWDDDQEWHDATTDAEGRFALQAPSGRRVVFHLRGLAPEWVASATPPWTLVAGDKEVSNLHVVRVKPGRSVGVTVLVLGPGGDPVARAEVGLSDAARHRYEALTLRPWPPHKGDVERTDAAGRASFQVNMPAVGEPPLSLYVAAPGLRPAFVPLPQRSSQDVLDTTVRLERGLALSGLVTDEAGNPLTGAEVTLTWDRPVVRSVRGRSLDGPHVVRTGRDGTYRVEGLAERTYGISVRAPEGSLAASFGLDVRYVETRALTLVIPRGGVAHGTVVDDEGVPIGNAHVEVRAHGNGTGLPSHDGWTDAAGRFEVRGLGTGRTDVFVSAEGFAGWATENEFLPARAPLRVVLKRIGFVRGFVQDGEGRPVVGARVSSEAWGPEVFMSGGRGSFLLPEPSMPVPLLADARGLAFVAVLWDPAQGPPVLRARAAGRVAGRVLDAEGEGKAGIEVRLAPVVDGQASPLFLAPQSTTTDLRGRFEFSEVYADTLIVAAVVGGTPTGGVRTARGQTDLVLQLSAPR